MITSEHILEVYRFFVGSLLKDGIFVKHADMTNAALELTKTWAMSQGPTVQDPTKTAWDFLGIGDKDDADAMGDSG